MCIRAFFAVVLLICSTAEAEQPTSRVLFDFSEAEAAKQWRTVNDGVMGGRSSGRVNVADDGTIRFFGKLSLENNGGFASVRSESTKMDLQQSDTLVARVKGDGRRYTLNLYVPGRRIAFSYRRAFETRKDEWIDVRIPLKDFVATSFGRIVRNAGPVTAQRVHSIGFLLADKKSGAFMLDVDWIKAESTATDDRKQANSST